MTPQRWHKLGAILGFYLAAAADGFLRAAHANGGAVQLCLLLGMSSTAAMWFALDATERRAGYAVPYQWIVFWLWPAFLPGYVIATRGFGRGLLRASLAGLGLAASYGLGFLSVTAGHAVAALLS